MNAILYIALGILIGGGLAALRILKLEREKAELKARAETIEAARAQMGDQFKLTAQEAVRNAHESFLQLAQEKLLAAQKDGSHDLEKRQKAIEEMVKPVHKQLEGLGKALEQSGGLQKAIREDLQNLGRETAKLAGALRNPAARGNWGEEMLERLLENSGLIKGINYDLQVSIEGGRPDAVIKLPESLHIVIDAKAPINDFVRNLDADMTESDYKRLQTDLARAVKTHIQDLGKKAYWEKLNSPDFVVLFLPSEHLFSAAVQADPSLLDLAAERKVVLASPVLTMSLLRVVCLSWRQLELAKNAQEISSLGGELYKRMLKFSDHMNKVGRHLQSAMGAHDAATGSLEKSVLPAARKMNELQGSPAPSIPEFEPIEKTPRLISLAEEDEKEKKRA